MYRDIDFSAYKIIRLTAPVFPITKVEMADFAERGIQPTVVDVEAPDVLIPHVADADIVVLIGTHLPTQVVEAMTNCRAIARMGAGTDKIDVARATELGIVVANTPYFCVEEQADHAMAMLLSLARKLILAQNAMAEGDIARARRAVSMNQRVSACTLGLVGFGRSAVHMARRARGFGMRVLATRRNEHAPTDEADALGVIMTDLETVLQESDYVSLHLPLNSATHHMIDAAALAKMKPSAYLINTSRGALVDESALADAIRSGRLAGAGIDTYEQMDVFTEIIPPRAHPLTGLENVILTPHVAAGSVQSSNDMRLMALDNIVDVLSGFWPSPENIVNPKVIPRYPLMHRVRT
ncbi:MAG: C-terminal binding protein [Caldilineaceae bacterium]|nr:C-terminal binding protein [Caldilineaceae bacterium]MBP8123074.1 C-terminal binding protein [Caldilineaceae bacterium]MBP9073388.1 C-terminal binding protein [Caldilineaceae bacterium]